MSEKEIYERLKYCLENDIKISRSLLTNYIYLLLDKYELKGYVYKLSLFEKREIDDGYYDDIHRHLFINYNELFENKKNIKYFNFQLLNTTFHELTHACQLKFSNQPDMLDKLLHDFYFNYILTSRIPENDPDFYDDNYNKFIFEYQAGINAIYKTYLLLDKLSIDDKLEYINRVLAKYIIKNYKNNSPMNKSINLIRKYRHMNLELNTPDIDIYYKLIFGYPIDDDSLKVIKEIAKGKVKTKNLLNKIKKEN